MISAPRSHNDKNNGIFPLQYLKMMEGVLNKPVPIILLVIREMHESVPNLWYFLRSLRESLEYEDDPIDTVGIKVGMGVLKISETAYRSREGTIWYAGECHI